MKPLKMISKTVCLRLVATYLVQGKMVFESIVGVKCFGTFVTRKTVLTMHLLVLKQFVLKIGCKMYINCSHFERTKFIMKILLLWR